MKLHVEYEPGDIVDISGSPAVVTHTETYDIKGTGWSAVMWEWLTPEGSCQWAAETHDDTRGETREGNRGVIKQIGYVSISDLLHITQKLVDTAANNTETVSTKPKNES